MSLKPSLIEAVPSETTRVARAAFSRYKGLQKTHLQEVAMAAGINILRTINHLNQVPVAKHESQDLRDSLIEFGNSITTLFGRFGN